MLKPLLDICVMAAVFFVVLFVSAWAGVTHSKLSGQEDKENHFWIFWLSVICTISIYCNFVYAGLI